MLVRHGDGSIAQQQTVRFLGLTLSRGCQWREHIASVSARLCSARYAILHIRGMVSSSSCLSFYYAYVHSYLTYGVIFWGADSAVSELFILQKKIVRSMSCAGFSEHCAPLFIKLRVMTVYSIYVYKVILYVRQNLNVFVSNGSRSSYATRNHDSLCIPVHSTKTYERGPYYMGTKLYNHLPVGFRQLNNFRFKTKLKDLLISNPLYGIPDFFEISCNV